MPRHGHMDELALPGGQLAQFGRRVMAQYRFRADPLERGPQGGLPARLTGERGVHTPVQPLPAPTASPGNHGSGPDPGLQGLHPGQHAPLEVDQVNAFVW